MDAELKDIVGVPFKVGDRVATDVTVNKTSGLRVGTVKEFNGTYIKVTYELTNRWDKVTRKVTVTRRPDGVVKVA